MKSRHFTAICLSAVLFACNGNGPATEHTKDSTTAYVRKVDKDSLQNVLNGNARFIGDSLLKNKFALITNYLSKYQPDTCFTLTYKDSVLRDGFEAPKDIGDINGDKIRDTVLVMPPFNYCDEGESYAFFDTTLPRLFADSYCCHPENLFSIGDIDEDGISEICIFYSTCVSRFKSLLVYTLKDNRWTQVGQCAFDIAFMKPAKQLRVRKTGKGKFEMLEIVDKETNREWKQFSFLYSVPAS